MKKGYDSKNFRKNDDTIIRLSKLSNDSRLSDKSEKLQIDKKASEDILKRYDDFLKNKVNKFDFLDKMNLNVVDYNLVRQIIIDAKKAQIKE